MDIREDDQPIRLACAQTAVRRIWTVELRPQAGRTTLVCPSCTAHSSPLAASSARSAALAHLVCHARADVLPVSLRSRQCRAQGCAWHPRHRGCHGPIRLALARDAGAHLAAGRCLHSLRGGDQPHRRGAGHSTDLDTLARLCGHSPQQTGGLLDRLVPTGTLTTWHHNWETDEAVWQLPRPRIRTRPAVAPHRHPTAWPGRPRRTADAA
ncbi:hypothetical protein [Streptomyces sp. 3213.3]|uniref:hypothetical protein n=1 Tax=Streptomyces sp. 3213.3 TaxID=1855348 RepID=UPI001F1F214C|nr:hypothetical protein [Streptomyces sp. 3213.3]